MNSLGTHTLVESYLDWWGEAGLTALASDQPVSWLTPPVATPLPVSAPTPMHADDAVLSPASAPHRSTPAEGEGTSPAVTAPLPRFTTLAEFDAWAARPGNLPFTHWSPRPALPFGPANPSIMLIGDFPEIDDCREGRLFSGAQGALLAAMLQAIDLDLSEQRCTAITLMRPPSPRFDSATLSVLMPLLQCQIALAQPKAVLVLGARSAGALTGRAVVSDADGQPNVNHLISNITPFITYHPRELLARPQLKRHAWEVLKRLRKQL